MLFPVTEAYEKMRIEQDEQVLKDGVEDVEDVIYFKQTSESAHVRRRARCGGVRADGRRAD